MVAAEVTVDARDRIVAWSPAAEALFGHGAAKALGQRLEDLLDGHDVFGNRVCHEGCWIRETLLAGEAVHRFELEVRHSEGHRIQVVVDADLDGKEGFTYRFLPERRRFAAPGVALARNRREPSVSPPLTPRELDVLRLLVRGLETEDMARELGICATTVRNHVQHLLDKLGVHNRLQAVFVAARDGIV